MQKTATEQVMKGPLVLTHEYRTERLEKVFRRIMRLTTRPRGRVKREPWPS